MSEVVHWTPNDLNVMLHYHGSATPHPRLHAPAVQKSVDNFLARDFLTETNKPGILEPTERGRIWVRMLCSVQPPECVWLDQQANRLYIGQDVLIIDGPPGRLVGSLIKKDPHA